MGSTGGIESSKNIEGHPAIRQVVDVTRTQYDEKMRDTEEKVQTDKSIKKARGAWGAVHDALEKYHSEATVGAEETKRGALEKYHSEETAVGAEETRGILNDIKVRLEECVNLANDMRNEFSDNFDFQNMNSDTEKQNRRISVMIDDCTKRPEERAEERKVWTNKVQADKLIFNDRSSEVSKYMGSLDNRIKHGKGDELYKKSGSAELTTSVKEQEFLERDWNVSQLRGWREEVENRILSLGMLRRAKEANPDVKVGIGYESRYLEHMQRLPQPKDVPGIYIQAKEAIRDVNQQLRETTDEKDIQKLLARLPDRELEKQLHVLDKEDGYRRNGRQEKRSTTFEPKHMDDAQLKRLLDGAREQTDMRKQAGDLFKIIKDRSQAKTSSTQKIKDSVRKPKEDFASVYSRISEEHYNGISQELSLRMRGDSMMREKSMWQALTKEDLRLTSEIVSGLSQESVLGFLNDPKETTHFKPLAEKWPDYAQLVDNSPTMLSS